MMSTSTIMLIDEFVNYTYNQDSKSLCCRHNWVFSRWLTGCDVSCSLVFLFRHKSGSQWYHLASRSSHSLSTQKSEEVFFGPKKPFSLSLFSFLYERVSRYYFFYPLVMMTGEVIITLCVVCGSFCKLQSHLWQGPSGFWH